MRYTIDAKPTVYNGTKYRSRLEARWAAMFDLLGWKHQYEPYDFKGWTPDFCIYNLNEPRVLLEIKPVPSKDEARLYAKKIGDVSLPAIMLCNEFEEDDQWSGGILAGYMINGTAYDDDIGEFELDVYAMHWKFGQAGVNSEWDIGSSYMSYDGVIWQDSDHSRRKIFLSDYYRCEQKLNQFKKLWLKAQELSTFHYR